MNRHHVMKHELHVWLTTPEFAKRVDDQPMPGDRRRNADSKRPRLAECNPFGAALRVIDVLHRSRTPFMLRSIALREATVRTEGIPPPSLDPGSAVTGPAARYEAPRPR